MRKLSVLTFALFASVTASSCNDATSKGGADSGAPEPDGSSGGASGAGAESDGALGGSSGTGSKSDGSSAGTGGGSLGAGGSVADGSSGGAGGGSSRDGGSSLDGGGNAGSAGSLPASTFLYVKAQTPEHDILVAYDLRSGEERIVTDLTGDGSDGWEIWGAAISPDRKRIAIASLFGPTKADNDTGLATRRIWTLNADGSDFQRLTPVFPNTSAGRSTFTIPVDQPAFTQDGSAIIYNFGNYWYESTTLKGGSLPWSISVAGGAVPKAFPTISTCSVLHPAVNPATGDVLFIHSVCIRGADEGLFLYPKNGGTAPTVLVQAGQGAGQVDPFLTPPSWVADGSGFVFVATTRVDRNGTTDYPPSLFVYDMATKQAAPLVIPDPNEYVQAAAIAPDASAIVYCLRHGTEAYDLHVVDLTTDPATDSPMTTDGKSCYPKF